ncbi:MAG: flagellin [Eubacteriales bacterium]
MSMSINNSTSGMNAYTSYLLEKKEKEKSMEKLSSGLQINSAGDNPAGLAVSEKMRAEITMNKAAQFNTKMASSAVKVAEGAMQSVNDMLVRATDLAMQSSNGTYTDVERNALQLEMDSLVSEINRVAASTNFNGTALLDGSLAVEGLEFQIGTSSDESISVNIEGASTYVNIDASQMNIVTQEQAQEILETLTEFVDKITSQRAELGGTQNRLDHTYSNLTNAGIQLQASESRIRDTDMAKESVNNSLRSVNSQSSISMLKKAQEEKEGLLNILGS